MWEFNRGDPNSLEGKASIYVRNRNIYTHNPSTDYFAFQIGHSLLDVSFSGEDFGDKTSFKEIYDHIKKQNSNRNNKDHDGTRILICRPFTFENPDDLKEIPGDIIFAGNISHSGYSQNILQSAAIIYSNDYSDQLFQRIGGNGKRVKIPKEDFKTLDEVGLVSRLSELTIDIYGSRELKDSNRESYARAQLMQLAHGAPFAPQVLKIVEAISTKHPSQQRIVELNIRLAGYIHGEKYQEAAKIKRELETL